MTEQAAEATPAEQPAQAEPEDTTDWKAEARKWETRAKENRTAAQELEKRQRESMSEAEKAVAEAESRGRTSAITDFGQRLARSDFIAAAARRNPSWNAADVLDDINLSRYVGEDGEPDSKAIEKAVARLVPEPQSSDNGSLDLGIKQTPATAPNMNSLLRKAAGRT